MDKLFHFQGNTNIVRVKGSQNQQYYSDVEAQDSPQDSAQVVVKKSSIASSTFKVEQGYATDDTSDNDSLQLKATSKMTNGKASKFKNLSTKQPGGDEGIHQEDDQNTENHSSQTDVSKLKVKKSNSILENAKKEVAPSSEKHSFQNQKDIKLRLLSENRHVDSDADAKKIVAKNQIIDHLKNHQYRHLIFSNYISESTFKKHLSLVYRGLVYAEKCLKGPSDKFILSKQVQIERPKISKGKTLFLDLDETLIHTCSLREGPDHIIQSRNEKGEISKIGLRVRPYCLEFLQKMTQFWDVYIFTASSSSYAETIINFLDPYRKYISGILNRANCMETKNGFFIKDLRIIPDSDLRYTVLVDNLSHSFGFQPDNGIPILEWHSDKQDTELKHLMNYLIQAAQSPDVREFNKQNLRLDQLIKLTHEQIGI